MTSMHSVFYGCIYSHTLYNDRESSDSFKHMIDKQWCKALLFFYSGIFCFLLSYSQVINLCWFFCHIFSWWSLRVEMEIFRDKVSCFCDKSLLNKLFWLKKKKVSCLPFISCFATQKGFLNNNQVQYVNGCISYGGLEVPILITKRNTTAKIKTQQQITKHNLKPSHKL